MSERSKLAVGAVMAALMFGHIAVANGTAVTVGPHYQEGSNRLSIIVPTANGCANTSLCHVIFNIVASGKQLLITDISCQGSFSASQPSNITAAEILTYSTAGQPTDRAHSFAPTITHEHSASSKTVIIKEATRQLVRAGERPVIKIQMPTQANITLTCSISGAIGNPPQ